MENECKTYENSEYKFLDFTDILEIIKYSFLDELDEHFELKYPLKIKNALTRRHLKHSTLLEILKSYTYVDVHKTNAILIPKDLEFTSNNLLDCDISFVTHVLRTIDSCKRTVPLLIKRVDCKFNELPEFLITGEGIEFLLQVDSDREKLRRICTFQQFKKFAKKEKLVYITEKIIGEIEFKRLFIS